MIAFWGGLLLGLLLGYFACEKVSEHTLTTARREGLRQGRAEREWEVLKLWDRVGVLERRNQR